MPTLAISSCNAGGDTDQTSDIVYLPVYKGERFIHVRYSDDTLADKVLDGTNKKYFPKTNIDLQFIPYSYSTTPVGLTDTGYTFSDTDKIIFDAYRQRLAGLTPYMNDPDI